MQRANEAGGGQQKDFAVKTLGTVAIEWIRRRRRRRRRKKKNKNKNKKAHDDATALRELGRGYGDHNNPELPPTSYLPTNQ